MVIYSNFQMRQQCFYHKSTRKPPNLQNYNIQIADVELIRIWKDCEEPATLGLFIDDSLSWKCHMAHANSKQNISRTMFAINQVKHILPYDSMKTFIFHYFSYVNSKKNISRTMFAINQVKHFLPYDSMKTFYFSLVHPHILYGILGHGEMQMWLPCRKHLFYKTSYALYK